MFNSITLNDLRELIHEPEWKVPALFVMTDEALIQELQRRGYVVKKEQKGKDNINGPKSRRT